MLDLSTLYFRSRVQSMQIAFHGACYWQERATARVSIYMKREANQNLILAYKLLLRNLGGVLTSCLVQRLHLFFVILFFCYYSHKPVYFLLEFAWYKLNIPCSLQLWVTKIFWRWFSFQLWMRHVGWWKNKLLFEHQTLILHLFSEWVSLDTGEYLKGMWPGLQHFSRTLNFLLNKKNMYFSTKGNLNWLTEK